MSQQKDDEGRPVGDVDKQAGARIRDIREKMGLTGQELAEKLSTSQAQVSRLECGKRRIYLGLLDKVAKALDRTVSDIVFDRLADDAVTVKYRAGAGIYFQSSAAIAPIDRYNIRVPINLIGDDLAAEIFGVEVVGPGSEQRIPIGAIAIMISFEENSDLIVGKWYVIQHNVNGKFETLILQLTDDDEGKLWFMPRTENSKCADPFPFAAGDGDYKIIGRLVGYFEKL